MSSREMFIFFFPIILLHFANITAAQTDPCINSANYTTNSTYQSNLETVLSSLRSHTTSNNYGFYNTSAGQGNDTVYAIALCRGDVSQDLCRSCVYNVTHDITELCPNKMVAYRRFDDLCMLRYSNANIFHRVEGIGYYTWIAYMNRDVRSPDQFNLALRNLTDRLQSEAAAGGSLRKFATGTISGPDFLTINALMQCTPDLSAEECYNCLFDSVRQIPIYFNGKEGGVVDRPSCYHRHEIYDFFSAIPAISLPQPPWSPPPSVSPPHLSRPPLPPPSEQGNVYVVGKEPDMRYNHCTTSPNYNRNSAYRTNLETVLSYLPSNTSNNYGFYNTSAGQDPDTVNTIALCRGDINQDVCRDCRNLTAMLQKEAAAGGSLRKFSTSNITVTDSLRIYGLMQCTPDLSEEQCNNCLAVTTVQITEAFNRKQGGRVFRPSCNFRYDINGFYAAIPAISLPSQPPPPSAPPSRSPPPPPGNNVDDKNLMLLEFDISSKASINNTNAKSMTKNEKVLELPMFSFSSISAATQNFSASNKLGEGGFGPVYKGNLLNGQAVAVKRLSRKSEQGLEELRNETILIAKLQHRNLVRVLGGCIEQDEKILIYEYLPNKSLDTFLFDPKKQELDWSMRVSVIEGIAQGLLYLHHYSRLRIVHRDLKASNILLDADINPKISDFGMARIFGGKDLQANTNRIVGTYGYMSPEYAMEGRFSIKSDVFAFGVLLLEILSGKKNTSFYHSDCRSLLGYAWKLWKNERVLELIDPILQTPPSCTALRYIHIGLLCVQENPAERPTMSEVLAMISNENATLDSPKQPGFTPGTNPNTSSSGFEICSNNGVTVSLLVAR